MPPSSDRAGDGPPQLEIEDRRALRWLLMTESRSDGPSLPFAREDVHEFRSSLRPPVPVLTVLDDGSQQQGESFRLRGEAFTIGRTVGELVLPNDPAISGQHAEIRRVPWKGGYQWQLIDLGSVNGTFVRCGRAVLHAEALVILGGRRFRLRNPLVPSRGMNPSATRQIDATRPAHGVWPMLVEAAQKAAALELPLRVDDLSIGRLGGGADIELDDPLLADRHAHLGRQRDGTWVIAAETTRNGVWVSVATVALTNHCFFRCGDQQFRFELP